MSTASCWCCAHPTSVSRCHDYRPPARARPAPLPAPWRRPRLRAHGCPRERVRREGGQRSLLDDEEEGQRRHPSGVRHLPRRSPSWKTCGASAPPRSPFIPCTADSPSSQACAPLDCPERNGGSRSRWRASAGTSSTISSSITSRPMPRARTADFARQGARALEEFDTLRARPHRPRRGRSHGGR